MAPRSKELNEQIRSGRREQIKQAAMKVFGRMGLAAAKISDIASEAGFSHGLVYNYFVSKDEIFTELVKEALDYSLDIIASAVRMEGTAWERIQSITETIVNGAYQGIAPYYFLIIIQAFTSDAVPPEVKELSARQSLLYNEYMLPLIKEGIESGDIAPGDPLQLSVAYFALIQGLAILKIQGGESTPDPSPDVVLRLLRSGPVLTDNYDTFVPAVFKPVFSEETLSYRASDGKRTLVIIKRTMENSENILKIEENNEAAGEKTLISARYTDLRPRSVQIYKGNGDRIINITYSAGEAVIDLPGRKAARTIKVKNSYYDMHTISYLFRGYPFGTGARINFNIVTDGLDGSPSGSFGMYVKETGREKVEVPAGIFECRKLEMGIAGIAGTFTAGYRFYFWYDSDPSHRLVRYEDNNGIATMLEKIESK